MAKSVLQVKNLSKNIGKQRIVQNINFDIAAGEVFGLIGPNGAGKTTVIRSIVSLIRRTTGTIIINGVDVVVDYKQAIAEVGAIIENPEFYLYLTGWEKLKQYARMSQKEISDQQIKAVVTLVKLSEAIQQKVRTYSLGMRQRLDLAQALLHRPTVLILDEPTNGLDPQGMADFRTIINQVAITSVYLTSKKRGTKNGKTKNKNRVIEWGPHWQRDEKLRDVLAFIARLTETELFTKKDFGWTGTANLGSYFV